MSKMLEAVTGLNRILMDHHGELLALRASTSVIRITSVVVYRDEQD